MFSFATCPPTPPESLHSFLATRPSPRLCWSSPLLFPAGVQRMATLGIDVDGILLTCQIHIHLHLFTSNGIGSIPVRSWSSALDILFGQNMCRIILDHLFWNTSSMWHIPLVTFQDSAAYSSKLSTLLLKMRIFVFLLVVFVFQMFFRAANAPLALLILVLISAFVYPSFVTLVRRSANFGSHVCELCYLFYVLFYECDWVCCLTVVSHCFGFVFVDLKSNFCSVSGQYLSFTLYVSVAVCQ